MNQPIVDQVRLVARLRAAEAEATRQYTESRVQWEEAATPLSEQRTRCQEELVAAERELRRMAVAEYRLTGSTSPAPGIRIKQITTLAYEPNAALRWAQQHGMALALDTRQFESLAKTGAVDSSVVQVTTEPRADITKDLDAALRS